MISPVFVAAGSRERLGGARWPRRVATYIREDLEAARRAGEVLHINVLGLATIAHDVTPELARATIASVSVLGALHASPAVKAALSDRTMLNQNMISEATRLTRAGHLVEATALLQRMLRGESASELRAALPVSRQLGSSRRPST
jgi:hypothetical protein